MPLNKLKVYKVSKDEHDLGQQQGDYALCTAIMRLLTILYKHDWTMTTLVQYRVLAMDMSPQQWDSSTH